MILGVIFGKVQKAKVKATKSIEGQGGGGST